MSTELLSTLTSLADAISGRSASRIASMRRRAWAMDADFGRKGGAPTAEPEPAQKVEQIEELLMGSALRDVRLAPGPDQPITPAEPAPPACPRGGRRDRNNAARVVFRARRALIFPPIEERVPPKYRINNVKAL
jgi:hypothetical protein